MPAAGKKRIESKRLKGGRLRLGVVAAAIGDLHTGRIWQGVSRAARELDFDLICFVADAPRIGSDGVLRSDPALDLVPAAGLDGLIVLQGAGLDPSGAVTRALQAGNLSVPMVAVGLPVKGVTSIRPDWEMGMRAALEHLIDEHECENIVLWTSLLERWVGVYRDVMSEHGLAFKDGLVVPWDDSLGGKSELLAAINRDVGDIDAVVVPSQAGARNIISALHSRSMLVPEDVKVIAFGSYDTAFMGGFLTEVRESVSEMGQTAVRMLLDHIREGAPLEDAVMPCELVVRGSCGCMSHWGTIGSGGTRAAAAQIGAETVALSAGAREELFAARAERLLQALEREIRQGPKGGFATDLEWLVHQEDKDLLSADAWKLLLLLIQRHVLHTTADLRKQIKARHIIAAAWSTLEKTLATESISTDFMERGQALKLFLAHRSMGESKDMATLNESAAQVAGQLGIPGLCVFVEDEDWGVPGGMSLTLAARDGERMPTGDMVPFADILTRLNDLGFLGAGRNTLLLMTIKPLGRPGLLAAEESPLDSFLYERLRDAVAVGLTNVLAVQVAADAVGLIDKQRCLLRNVMDSIGSSVYVKDVQGRFVLVNRTCMEETGVGSEDEMIGKTDFDFLDMERAEKYMKTEREVVTTGQAALNVEISHGPRGAEGRHYLVSKTPLKGADGKIVGIVGVNRDVTEIKAVQSKLRDKELELHQAQKMDAIGQLAGGIAHDFNNLLAVILGYAEHVKRDTKADENIHEAAGMIEDASKQAAALVRQLLDFSRQGQSERRPVDVHDVVRNTLAMLCKTFDRRIEIIEELNSSPSVVTGDPVQLQQVVLNLAVNARDAMKDGGRLVFKSYMGRVGDGYPVPYADAPVGKYVVLCVSDTGHGIEAGIKNRIFEPFFTTKEKGSGTGMGLATTYGIVRSHGGWIDVQSEPGKGSTFTIWLPVAFSIHGSLPVEEEQDPVRGHGTILVIDDEPGMRRVLERTLTRLGYNVVLTADGQEGLDRFRESGAEIDLVILDWDMPKMGGRECLEGIRKVDPCAKIVVSSGFLRDWDGSELADLDVTGYIKKPYTHFTISKCVDEILHGA